MTIYGIIISAIFNSLLNGTASIFFKKKLTHQPIAQPKDFIFFLLDPLIIFACFLIFISMYFSIKTLSFTKLSIALPLIFSCNLIFSTLAGAVFFQEKINLHIFTGLILILIGIFFLTTPIHK